MSEGIGSVEEGDGIPDPLGCNISRSNNDLVNLMVVRRNWRVSKMSKQGAKRHSKKMSDGATPLSNHGTV